VVSVVGEDEVDVAWKASTEEDVAGYVVEEADVDVVTDDQLIKLKVRTPPLEKPYRPVVACREMTTFSAISVTTPAASAFTNE